MALHADAVLSWIVAGHFDYEDNGGMREPASVLHATGAYQADSDAVARFITERCFVSPVATASTRELFTAWQRWAIADGAEQLAEKPFSKELDRLGYEAKRTKAGMRRTGLGLLIEDDETAGV